MATCDNCKREVDHTEGVFVAHGSSRDDLVRDKALRLCPQCESAVLHGVDTVLQVMRTAGARVKDR